MHPRTQWSTSQLSHAQMLEMDAQPIGDTLMVHSVCAFTANKKAGVAVAVVLDGDKKHDERSMTRIAERCIESCVVVVQPYGSGSRGNTRPNSRNSTDSRGNQTKGQESSLKGNGSYVAKLFLLTPGGPSSRTMSASMMVAGISTLLERPSIHFAPLYEGMSYAVKVCSPLGKKWDETLDMNIGEDGAIWVKVPNPKIEQHVAPEDVCEALNLNMLSLQTDMPVQVVSSVARHILVPVRSRRQMNDLDPYWDLISEVCRKYNAEGFHLFSLDPMAGGAVHTRNLSPLVRLEEEAASPSANAALTGYIHLHRILPLASQETFICEQGWALGMKQRPSKVYVRLELAAAKTHSEPIDIPVKGVTQQNQRAGGAMGAETTRERLMEKGDRYTSNYIDQSRFNLPENYYEEEMQKALEIKMEQERFKRAGKEWKEDKKPHVSNAIVPPPIALPATIVSCWVGGTAVPGAPYPEYPIDY